MKVNNFKRFILAFGLILNIAGSLSCASGKFGKSEVSRSPVSASPLRQAELTSQEYLMLGNFNEDAKDRIKSGVKFKGMLDHLKKINKDNAKNPEVPIYWLQFVPEADLHVSLLTIETMIQPDRREDYAAILAGYFESVRMKSSYKMHGYDVRLLVQGNEYGNIYGKAQQSTVQDITKIKCLPDNVRKAGGKLMQIAVALRITSNAPGIIKVGDLVDDVEESKVSLDSILLRHEVGTVSQKFGQFKGHTTLAFLRKYENKPGVLEALMKKNRKSEDFQKINMNQDDFVESDMPIVEDAYRELKKWAGKISISDLTMGDYTLSYRYRDDSGSQQKAVQISSLKKK